jgi:hypothetical protein
VDDVLRGSLWQTIRVKRRVTRTASLVASLILAFEYASRVLLGYLFASFLVKNTDESFKFSQKK